MKNIIRFKEITSLFFAFLLFYLNSYNNHGDYLFFKNLYQNFSTIDYKLVFPYYFGDTNDYINYSGSEDFFKFIFFTSSKFISYSVFSFCVYFFLFHALLKLLDNGKIENHIIFLLVFTNFYIYSIALASIKNSLSIIFLLYSFYFYNISKKKLFLVFYIVTTCVSIYTLIIYILLSILHFKEFRNFLKNLTSLKLLILIIPILINYGLILGKVGGYSDQDVWKKYKIQNNIEIETNKENINKFIISNNNFVISNTGRLDEFVEILKERRNIKIFSINTDFIPSRFGPWYNLDKNNNLIDKDFYLTFSILDLFKFLLFNIIIYSLLNASNKKFFLLYIFTSLLIFSLINFTRFTLILSIIYLVNLAYFENIIKKYNFRYFFILIFCSYGILKCLLLIFNLILYNEIY
jgi:hypothetical protein